MPRLKVNHVDPYLRQFTYPKWSRTVRVTDEHKLFRYLPEFSSWTKAQHYQEALDALQQARAIDSAYQEAVQDALRTYGSQGSLISGIVRDHFPDEVKDLLRSRARALTYHRDRSVAHWQAAGKRLQTWRQLNQESK